MSFPQGSNHANSQYPEYQVMNNQQYPSTTATQDQLQDVNFQENYIDNHSNQQYISQDDYVLQDLDNQQHQYEEDENMEMEEDSINQNVNLHETDSSRGSETQNRAPAVSTVRPHRICLVPHRTSNLMLIDTKKFLEDFWVMQKRKMETMTEDEVKDKCKHMPLPQARVKKIMRIDEDVKNLMISGDAPLFLAAAAELFIEEVTSLAWHVVEESRRRTMQKADIVVALQRSEQFDFLIDLIPRDPTAKAPSGSQEGNTPANNNFQSYQTVNENIQQQVQQAPQNIPRPAFVHQESHGNNVLPNTTFMRPPDTITITLDEHGSPIGELPHGVQIVVHRNAAGGSEYQVIQNGNRNIEFRQVNRSEHEHRQAQRVNFRVGDTSAPNGNFNRL